MRVRLWHTAVGLALCLTAPPAFASSIMLGSNGSVGLNPGAIVKVDQTTGAGTVVGDPAPPGGLSGLVFGGGTLFATTAGSSSTLITVDPNTGALISTVGGVADGATHIAIGDLAWDPLTGVLYGVESNGDGRGHGGDLYTINTSTGAATFVGDTGAGANGGLAFAPDGTLYQAAYNNHGDFFSLNTLDKTNASRISTVALSNYFDGLGIRDDRTIFAAPGGSSDAVYTINPITGAATFIGSTGTGGLSDITFIPVPEPGTLSLLGLSLGVAAFRFRRRA